VSGTTITASWANASVRDQVVTPFASSSARASTITSPVEGMVSFLNDVNSLEVFNGTVWVPTAPVHADLVTSENTGSTSFTDLATGGPQVTVVTGASALVMVDAQMINTGAGNSCLMGFAVSGASTSAAGDSNSASVGGNLGASGSATFKIGLTNGSNTFTAKYRVSAGTGSFQYRSITVWPLP
jgi:hypothetical protein